MSSKFYNIPGSHVPSGNTCSNELTSLLPTRKASITYFNYTSTPAGQKVSSKYDPNNPNKDKLGTYDGVFIPTTLNVLSILMFLRFGFVLGQLGIICTLGLLLLSYLINLLTTLSISAISTNGTIRGGGAYYMISRCLGPEFGGSIGLVFFLGQVFNSAMNAVGISEPLLYNFGIFDDSSKHAALFELLPVGKWNEFIYSSTILFLCITIALVGSQTVSRAGNFLFFILMSSIISIPLSLIFKSPFKDVISYSGPSWDTFKENLYPHLTKGAAGSMAKGKETFNDLFGVFFPATAGIFAGAGMSSELRKPSKSIPKGTLWGLLFTFLCYAVVVLSMGCSIPRKSLYEDVQIIQSVSALQSIIFLGEMATSIFSITVGMLGAAYVLEAIARDSIFPGLSFFCKNQIYSLLFTWLLTQLCLFSDVNKIATLITMTFLMTFVVMNLACFLLRISSAPNFRPSFKYFDKYTALTGTIISSVAMFIVDGMSASAVILAMILIFVFIHYVCPPKSWGDVSQTLIYHQVRKYLLRLRQDNIKYWRPQILLFVDNPRTSWNLIKFCNHLKKGGLYVLGHVTITNDFQNQFKEVRKQQDAWVEIRDMTNIKAFVQIGTGPNLPWSIRNVFMGCGLGGMKPNITIIGFFDLESYYGTDTNSISTLANIINQDVNISNTLPTDDCKNENKVTVQQWVEIIEDLTLMKSNIAIARGFGGLQFPSDLSTLNQSDKSKKYIDLYPIQMLAKMTLKREDLSLLTTNFDTYTLILQLGAILVTVPQWKKTHVLRVILFVETESERLDELDRMNKLLEVLRIDAKVLIVALDQFRVYNTIVKGNPIMFDYVSKILKDDPWWNDLVESRNTLKPLRRFSTSDSIDIKNNTGKAKKYKTAQLQQLGISLTMSSNMPHNYNGNDYLATESDEDETDLSLTGSNSSLLPQDQRLKYELFRRSHYNNGKKPSSIKGIQSTLNASSIVNPVFSSNALPRTKIIEEGSGDKPTIIPVENDAKPVRSESPKQVELNNITSVISNGSLVRAMQKLTFNDLPCAAQYLILNDLMVQLSSNSDLIFSTLPLPALQTHKDHGESLQYVRDLDLWLEGLPPTMLINSQTMTVTTAL
ncbi:hypothetical protein TPHA_0N01150 [Tetrapisispora phaffii CBS 4417]|uniref:Amino acid permease/ SLC12A domain-containing protein n=1 Tax=Tetrapisispora phaffii (strain ATCC 24235 / CBS 4417 / NBRC 1672 / NRRL Y-8282 / UCD 70-5) TaxID=1071381 RepID=G8C168_TETPH|nr:hypothetical protein TPHA_0N01150 [Tetrapisispora phaffii CBS 4417]CCE65896.1 hypothetical protein TPHA_0N01150 [Tetrapisispora phaffii CBS 4417]